MAPKKQALPIGAAKVIKNPKKVPRPKVSKRAHAGAPPGEVRIPTEKQPATGPLAPACNRSTPSCPQPKSCPQPHKHYIYPRMPAAEVLMRLRHHLVRETIGFIWHAIEADQEDRFELSMRAGIWMARASRLMTVPEVFENDNVFGPEMNPSPDAASLPDVSDDDVDPGPTSS